MTDPKPKLKAAFILSNFNDAGTGESYAAGAVPDLEPGLFENYRAGGLVRTATAAEIKRRATRA